VGGLLGGWKKKQCVLVRISNMVTLQRIFVSVSSIGEMFSPLQRQLLDPMSCKQLSPAIIQRSFQSLETFKVCKILNSTQLMAVSALLSLRQGFLLVQGKGAPLPKFFKSMWCSACDPTN
jgi:hypothetical protein